MEQIEEYFPRAVLERFGESLNAAGAQAEAMVEEAIARLEALRPERATLPTATGLAATVVNVNPFFGALSPLDSVRMAALHARHHIRKHLSGQETA